jgi:hypothetical protein
MISRVFRLVPLVLAALFIGGAFSVVAQYGLRGRRQASLADCRRRRSPTAGTPSAPLRSSTLSSRRNQRPRQSAWLSLAATVQP